MHGINNKLSGIGQSVTLRLADRARELEAQGRRIVKLQTGDPDFATHPAVVRAAHKALVAGNTHYSDTRGLPALREAVAQKLSVDNGISYDPATEILITHGGVHAIFCAIHALVNPGDEVIIVDPCWMPYISGTLLAGAVPVRVSTSVADGFRVDPQKLREAITPRTRLLIINSPCNPTGHMIDAEALVAIGHIAQEHDFCILSDEVYEKLTYGTHVHHSMAAVPGMKERTVTINSFSKTYAMTGWRIGYLAACPEFTSAMLKMSQYSITNVASFSQLAAVTALCDDEVQAYVREMHETYTRRRALIADVLDGDEVIRCRPPDGAFYYMLDLSAVCNDSAAFADRLLEEEGVCLIPGVGFGACGEGCLRVTFAAAEDKLKAGLAGIRRLAERMLSTANGGA